MNGLILMIIFNFNLHNMFFCDQLINYFYRKILKLPDIIVDELLKKT